MFYWEFVLRDEKEKEDWMKEIKQAKDVNDDQKVKNLEEKISEKRANQ